MYFLVLLRDADPGPLTEPDHEPPVPGVSAAYVLRCDGLAEAEAIVASDPLVAEGAIPALSRWDLVGINTRAIDPTCPSARQSSGRCG